MGEPTHGDEMSAALESLMRDLPRRADMPKEASLIAFVFIGGSGALAFVALSTIMVGVFRGADSWVVSTFCYAALILPVYLLQKRFSFRSDAPHVHALPRYVAVQAMALVLTALFGFVAYGVLALPNLAAAIIISVLTAGVNFVILRGWAFAVPHAIRQSAAGGVSILNQ